ncbi:MAG: hypothetical protein C0390_04980 [Syntrophus sp. (in: bacteria)]|nr:hypothetical protein [Syntrophus sp. (in: bacteria)]
MPPWPSREKMYDMDTGEPRDSELEQELDSLYRKVAGLDQPGDKHDRTVLKTDEKTPAAANIQKPITTRSAQKKRRRFRTSRFGWGLVFTLFFLSTIGFFYWSGAYYDGTFHFREIAYPLKTDPLTGEARYDNEKERLRPPVDTGIIALTAEESKDQAVAPLPVAEEGKVLAEPPAADTPPEGRRGRYAIQIRAYPEDQKQNALMFLEDVRKRAPDVSMETISIAGRGVWHRILLGNFSTAEEAAEYQKSDTVAREHPYGFIQRKHGSDTISFPIPRSAAGEPPT